MTRLLVDPVDPDREAIGRAADVLRRGGIVAYPTDTLYALAVDPRASGAVQQLFGVKGRDAGAAIALIAADVAQAEQAGRFGPGEQRLAAAFWPGPLTIVVAASPRLSPLLLAGSGSVGVRVPAHPVARALALGFGGCITATSANRSGAPATATADDVAMALGGSIDLLIDAGPAPGGAPSTVIEIVEGRARQHRAGAVAWDRVLESLQ